MQNSSRQYIPRGWHNLTPRLVVRDPKQLVEFLRAAFGAKGRYDDDHPSIMRLGDSTVMVSGIAPRKPMPGFFYLYVANADRTYRNALRAGAKSIEPPTWMPYGDRRAMVRDPFGNHWQIATYGKPKTAGSKRAAGKRRAT